MKVIKMEIEAFIPGVGGSVDLKEFCSDMTDAIKAAVQLAAMKHGVTGSTEMSATFSQGEEDKAHGKDEYGATKDCECLACRLLRKAKRGESYEEEMEEAKGKFPGELSEELEIELEKILDKQRSARLN